MTNRAEVTREIAASPEEVYAAISDISRMGEWSPETYRCAWKEGHDGPAVGAEFEAHNRYGDAEWANEGTVTEADPAKAFAFSCAMMGFTFANWGYRIEPTENGSRVTEWTENELDENMLAAAREISGVEDRMGRNEETMGTTLDNLAAALES